MWLYNALILATFASLVSSGNLSNTKKRLKQNGNNASVKNNLRHYYLSSDDKDEMQIPMKIPKLSKSQKIALIIESGQNPFERKQKRKEKGRKHLRQRRHTLRNPSNPFLFLDDSDDDEYQWKSNKYRKNTNTDEAQHLQHDGIENHGWKTTIEFATPLIEFGLGTKEKPNDSGKYWETSTSTVDTTTQLHGKKTTSKYSNISTSAHYQIFADRRLLQQNVGTPSATPSTTIVKSSTVQNAVLTTTVVQPFHHLVSNGTKELNGKLLFFVTRTPPQKPHQPLALPMKICPHRFDAVTRAFNGRTYVFARDRVYQLWRHDNLHQKASFLVREMFPNGPRTVTVAYTNNKSGVTVLIEHQTVYRYRWNRKKKVFYLARKSPQTLTKKMPVYPRAGFQWVDGNQVLVEGDSFATYDAYWNVATFSGLTRNYFPQFPSDLIGLTYQNDTFFILYTASNKIQIYDTEKYRVIQEYPIQINEFVGCFKS